MIFPKDTEEAKKERKAVQIVLNAFDMNTWVNQGCEVSDHGVDYKFEGIRGNEFHSDYLFTQIKGRKEYKIINDNISFPLELKTISFALNSSIPFALFLVDLSTSRIYYIIIQDYFKENKQYFSNLNKNKGTVNIHVPLNNVFDNEKLLFASRFQYILVDKETIEKKERII